MLMRVYIDIYSLVKPIAGDRTILLPALREPLRVSISNRLLPEILKRKVKKMLVIKAPVRT